MRVSQLIPFLSIALVAGCFDGAPTDPNAKPQSSMVLCSGDPAGVFRPECQSNWSSTDATPAVRQAIDAARAYIDASNCDIRTTSQYSPYNSQERWCGGVVFQAGVTYNMATATQSNPLYVTAMGDFNPVFSGQPSNPGGDAVDTFFGVTLESDNQSGTLPVLQFPQYAMFVIGPYDRLIHLHIKGPWATISNIPACTASRESLCPSSVFTESGVLATSDTTQGYNEGWKIDGVVIDGFSAYGLNSSWSKNGVVVNSTINSNGDGGILNSHGLGLTLSHNYVYLNGANGIDMGESRGSATIEYNEVYDNNWRNWDEAQGIIIAGTSNNTVYRNHVYRSSNNCSRECFGIVVVDGSNNQILENTVTGHTEAGIQVGWCQNSCTTYNTVVSNNILANNGTGYGHYQIEFELYQSGTVVSSNHITPPGPCIQIVSYVAYSGNTCGVGVEGESYTASYQVYTDTNNGVSTLAGLGPGSWAKYSNVNFGTGSRSMTFRIAIDPCCAERRLEIRLGSTTGTLIGNLIPQSTGGWWAFTDQVARIAYTSGTYDVYLVAQGGWGVGNIDRFWLDTNDAPVSAYSWIEGEAFDGAYGVYAHSSGPVGALGGFGPGYWAKFSSVLFSSGASTMTIKYAVDPCCAGQQMSIHIGSPYGAVIGYFYPTNTGDWWTWQNVTISAYWPYAGAYDVYIVNDGGWGAANIEQFKFNP